MAFGEKECLIVAIECKWFVILRSFMLAIPLFVIDGEIIVINAQYCQLASLSCDSCFNTGMLANNILNLLKSGFGTRYISKLE